MENISEEYENSLLIKLLEHFGRRDNMTFTTPARTSQSYISNASRQSGAVRKAIQSSTIVCTIYDGEDGNDYFSIFFTRFTITPTKLI